MLVAAHGAKLLCQATSKLDAWTIERCVAIGFASKMGWSTAGRPRRRHAAAQVMATVRPDCPNRAGQQLASASGGGFRGSKRHHLNLPTTAVETGGVQPAKMPITSPGTLPGTSPSRAYKTISLYSLARARSSPRRGFKPSNRHHLFLPTTAVETGGECSQPKCL